MAEEDLGEGVGEVLETKHLRTKDHGLIEDISMTNTKQRLHLFVYLPSNRVLKLVANPKILLKSLKSHVKQAVGVRYQCS